ncbi:Protein of unknown function (plasmid) [Azospirillum lipoferum 4B]|uniref:Uncharacterized protein n=1 Tax=Azospirillum lipoferum (strain 4B) TaxID=862719 RepID=G7ZHQ8_AZOL4|nr:Protein of unknown function [Azospirillum lipoferum 4B]
MHNELGGFGSYRHESYS